MIVAALVLNSMFPPNLEESKKVEMLTPFFDPAVGEKVTISRSQVKKNRANPLMAKGYIWVTPPEGSCFIITKNKECPDINVCERKKVYFRLKDIDPGGKLTWRIIQGKKDPGTEVTWHSDYRISNYAPLGEFESGNNQAIPLYSCKASGKGEKRRIVLEFFNGRVWYITFPEVDTIVKKRKEKPNLFVPVMTTAKDGQAVSKDLSTGGKAGQNITKEDIKRKHSVLSLKLSGRYKEKKKETYKFITSPYNSYKMNSSFVYEEGSPPGMNGSCRYRFKNAPGDPESGLIECFNTDTFDAVFTHLPCAGELPLQLPADASENP